MTLQSVFADLHIHIGKTENGTPIKISGSRDLTFINIAYEASERKGIELIGIIDCHSPAVQEDIANCLDQGEMEELPGGGIRYRNTTIVLGSEIEVRDPGLGPAHVLAYLPTFEVMKQFTKWMSRFMKNPVLSSQRIYVPAAELQREVYDRGGFMIPAHVFTPHRSIYGSCSERMADLLDLDKLAAIELGLSADSGMAGYISELETFSFVTNSDAHSLAKIGREYNKLLMGQPDFTELQRALKREDGRGIEANYGLNPRLGKYYRTYCAGCDTIVDEAELSTTRCALCGSTRIVRGVLDRILSVADRQHAKVPDWRPPYVYQIPLEFIPGLGKKTRDKLLDCFGTEMNIIHKADEKSLIEGAGERAAAWIIQARTGKLELEAGGGGKYGKINNEA